MKNGELKLQIPEVCNSFLKCHQFDVCFDCWTAMYYEQYPDENNV